MNVESWPGDVACSGPSAPKCKQIDDLIKLLVTIRERFGNTAIKYDVKWGSYALWVADAQRIEIEKLKMKIKRLKESTK